MLTNKFPNLSSIFQIVFVVILIHIKCLSCLTYERKCYDKS